MNCAKCLHPLELEVLESENVEMWRYVCKACKFVGRWAYTPAQAELLWKHPEYAEGE